MHALPLSARLYVAAVIAAGSYALAAWFPRTVSDPTLFAVMLAAACVTAAWKVNLLIPLGSGSTLSVSYAAKLMALLLLGPQHAVLVAAAGALTQCTYKVKQPYPLYRTVFSVAAEAVTMAATGTAYVWLGGSTGPFDIGQLARPLVGAITTYFVCNTGLIAAAIALTTNRRVIDVWRDDFLWSGVTFMFAGTAGALAAVVIDRGEHWKAVLLLAPVYLTYRTYELFVGRLDDQQRHMAEMRRLHQETVEALSQAHKAEKALADEKERLAAALADMTELEEMKNQLLEREQSARASAEQANRLKDQFLAIVSHELRTPLNAILGWADMLCAGKLDAPRRDRAYQVIHDSARRQAQLIEDLLDVARIMSGKLRLDRTIVDIEEVVRGAMHVVQPSAHARRLQIGLDVEPAVGFVYGDRARLQQIVWNLLSNAIKFTPEDGSVYIALRRANDIVEIVVTDTGQGIPTTFLASVFEPFRQADGSATRLHGGLGLGLSIVKHLVEAHGGAVGVHSDGDGKGATFSVRLPVVISGVVAADADDRCALAAAPVLASASLDGVSVLIVDDDEDCRQVAAAHLEGQRAHVITAASASEAIAILHREPVDVLLADIAMPGEDGYSLIRTLRASPRTDIARIPAAAVTAFARNEDRHEALRAGFQMHLAKPFDAYSIVTAVSRLRGTLFDRRNPAAPKAAPVPAPHNQP